MKRSTEFWIVAYFLSKFGDKVKGKKSLPPKELNTTKWEIAYNKFYHFLGKEYSEKSFKNTLKNCRDAYDGYILTSGRIGWRGPDRKPADLSEDAKAIFDQLEEMTRTDIWLKIQSFITDNRITSKIRKNERVKNPDWTREELIIALDLYFNLDQGQMHKGHPEVIRVSNQLRNMNLNKDISEKEKFRTPSSISRRLGNFKAMDSGYKGSGLSNFGKLAKEVFNEFANHRDKLKKEADLIKHLYLETEKNNKASDSTRKYRKEFLFNYHRNKELDPVMIEKKKDINIADGKNLICEICGFDPLKCYGEIGRDLMEIHLNKDLNNDLEIELIDLDDFIIVCSNCHKVLDKHFDILNASDLKKIIQK